MTIPSIEQDGREVWEIDSCTESGVFYCVGRGRTTRIEAYLEDGEMAGVPWFAVWEGKHLCARVRAGAITEVRYKKPD